MRFCSFPKIILFAFSHQSVQKIGWELVWEKTCEWKCVAKFYAGIMIKCVNTKNSRGMICFLCLSIDKPTSKQIYEVVKSM